MNTTILIYGANGYTGKLFAKYLLSNGIKPILAGRGSKVKELGKDLDCPTRVFSTKEAENYLDNVDFLVNLAGPFSTTQDDLIQAAIQTNTHYLDIAGEFPEMDNAFKYHKAAQKADLVILPGAGFGVVPTDIAAKMAADQINAPTHLEIVFATKGGASRGTLKTILKDIQKPGHVFINGQYQKALPAQKKKKVEIFNKVFTTVYNPWRADLFTAHWSTGIDNIETYSEFPGFIVKMMKGKLTGLRDIILNRLVTLLPEGPSAKQLEKGNTYVKAIARNQQGQISSVDILGPEAYAFTVICILKMIELIDSSEKINGCLTPSMLGTNWIMEMEGVLVKKFSF